MVILDTLTDLFLRENLNRVIGMEKVDLVGLMVKFTTESGRMVSSMEVVYGEVLRETNTWDNGIMVLYKGMVFMYGLMVIAMRGNLKLVSSMD